MAGEWSLERRGDELADIAYRGRTILRGVRAVVRDHGWLTVPVEVLTVDATGAGLVLYLHHVGLGARIRSTLRVAADGARLRVEWNATNSADFDTCRTGLVVLHPPTDAGSAITIEHSDGRVERTALPVEISPHQPVFDIRALRVGEGESAVDLRFEGDVFEMEDQRNWTDASFKTYSRPLSLPYPYLLAAAERVNQSITVSVADDAPAVEPGPPCTEILELSGPTTMPAVGVEISTIPDPVRASTAGAFRVVELDLTTPTWPAALDRAARDGLPLDVRLVTDGHPDALAAAAHSLRDLDLLRVTPFDKALHVSDSSTVDRVSAVLTAAGIKAPVWGGSRSHFTELNREFAQIPADVAGIAVNVTPLFHAVDTEQLVESVAMQRLVAQQTVAMADGRPVSVGPVALRPRYNNVATTAEPAPTRADLSEGFGAQFTSAIDPRQATSQLAAWTIASAAALTVPGVEALSYFETAGPRGILAADGSPMPVAAAIDTLVAFAGQVVETGASSDQLVWVIRSPGVVLIANLDRVERRIALPDCGREIVVGAGEWSRIDM